MKINLAENMLRFGVKNLNETATSKVKTLAEQKPTAPGKPEVKPAVKPAATSLYDIKYGILKSDVIKQWYNLGKQQSIVSNGTLYVGNPENQAAADRQSYVVDVYKFTKFVNGSVILPFIERVGSISYDTYTFKLDGNQPQSEAMVGKYTYDNSSGNYVAAAANYINMQDSVLKGIVMPMAISNLIKAADFSAYTAINSKNNASNPVIKSQYGYLMKELATAKSTAVKLIVSKLNVA